MRSCVNLCVLLSVSLHLSHLLFSCVCVCVCAGQQGSARSSKVQCQPRGPRWKVWSWCCHPMLITRSAPLEDKSWPGWRMWPPLLQGEPAYLFSKTLNANLDNLQVLIYIYTQCIQYVYIEVVTIHSIRITILGVQYNTYHDILNNILNETEIQLTDLC